MRKTLFIFLCFLMSTFAIAQTHIAITGTVVDEQGQPLIGATVIEKANPSNGATTNLDGAFSLSAPRGGILQISYIGYITQEATIAPVMRVVLKETASALGEVVVIGYGSQRKEDLSMAVSTVKMDQTLKSRTTGISSILQGQVPGLTIQANGGDPLKGSTYSIRGKGSRDNDDILTIVDGVPGAPYNLDDVESITVLKDAASAAIYGAQVGAGGVIVITTKKAQSGKIQVDANLSYGVKNVWRRPHAVTAEQYSQLWQDAIAASVTQRALPVVADPNRYAYGQVTRTDWIDEVLRTGAFKHASVSFTGGTETIKTLASIEYDRNEGTMLNTWSENIGAKINLDFQLAKWIKLSERVSFTYSNGQGDVWNGSHQGVLLNAIFYPRSTTVYEMNQDGTYALDNNGQHYYSGTIPKWAIAQGIAGYGEIRNPVATLMRIKQNRPSANVYSTTSLEIKPFSGLSVRSDLTYNLAPGHYDNFEYKVPEYGLPNAQNSRYIEDSWNYGYLWENIATYTAEFDKHNISAMAGFTMKYNKWTSNNTSARDFDREDSHYQVIGNANDWSSSKPGESISEEAMVSALGRVGYSFADRYFATASIRRDASSKLAPENNSGIFPALSASWKISSEEFFDLPFINLLKLRAGWGQIGNVATVPNYSYNAPLSMTDWPAAMGQDMQGALYGVYVRTIANRALTWETSEQTSLGLDITLLDKTLDVSIDFFNKLTKDLIDRVPIPRHAGIADEPYGNVGKVRNRGWEFSVNYNNHIGDLTYSAQAMLSTVSSEVLDLGTRTELTHTNSVDGGTMQPLRSAVGQPWYSYKLIKTDGIFQTQGEIDAYVDSKGAKIQPNARPGDLKFIDFNDDGKINDNDRQYMGSYLPKLSFSFGGSAQYKGFDLNIFFQGVSGVKIFNGFKMMGMNGRQQGNYMLVEALDSWIYDHTSSIPNLGLVDDPNNNWKTASDFFLEDGTYLRLKNLTLGYTVPVNMMSRIGLKGLKARVYLGAENLLTFTGYTGFDPEVGNSGLDVGTYPVSRVFNFGINLNF